MDVDVSYKSTKPAVRMQSLMLITWVNFTGLLRTDAQDRGKLVTLIADKRRRLLFAVDGRRSVYVKKPHRYAEENRKKLIVKQWYI